MLNKAKGRMFNSVGWTWNPLAGCSHNCKYCWAKQLTKRWGKDFKPKFRSHYLVDDKMPDDGSWIFVGSMGDVFCDGMKREWIESLLNYIDDCEADNKFLLQTKNPRRFLAFLEELERIRDKVILGTTIETNRATPWSDAPNTFGRCVNLGYMKEYGNYKSFLSLEPLSDFDVQTIITWIDTIKPEAIELGLENYTNYTIRPPNWKIVGLIQYLEDEDINYVLKENLEYLKGSLPSITEAE